jgi:ankyrin repeat protein
MKVLLHTGFELDAVDSDDNTILHDATQLRISNNPFISSDNGSPSKVSYLDCNRADRVSVLLQHGADPNAQNSTGDTALHTACRSERKACEECGPAFKSTEFITVLQHLRAHGAKVDI